MTHPQTTLFSRRTLLKGAAGLSLAALASAAACGGGAVAAAARRRRR